MPFQPPYDPVLLYKKHTGTLQYTKNTAQPEINLFDIPVKKLIKSSYVREKAGQGTDISVCALSGCCFHEQLALRANFRNYSMGVSKCQWIFVQQKISKEVVQTPQLELFKFVLGIVRDRYNIVLELFQVTSHFFCFSGIFIFFFLSCGGCYLPVSLATASAISFSSVAILAS